MMLSPRIDADALAVGEMLGQRQRVRDAAFAFLIGVVQMLQAELAAVGQQAQKIARIPAAGDDQNLSNARIHQRLDGVVNHGLVVNRQQVLVGDLGQRKHAAAGTARQHDALQKATSMFPIGITFMIHGGVAANAMLESIPPCRLIVGIRSRMNN